MIDLARFRYELFSLFLVIKCQKDDGYTARTSTFLSNSDKELFLVRDMLLKLEFSIPEIKSLYGE
jgi:hypothetical protein